MVFLNLIYPPLCIHCEQTLEKKRSLLCATCLELLISLTNEGRCLTCFAELEGRCERCRKRSVVIRRQAAVCQSIGPAQTLISRLEKGELGLVQHIASLMLLQWTTLGWPVPDFIVPLPIPWWNRCQLGGDIHAFLARQLAQALNVPVFTLLKCEWTLSGLLNGDRSIKLRAGKKLDLIEKTGLLISLRLHDGQFRAAGEAMLEGFPSCLTALAFAL